jgi:hypothetical protein
MDGQTAAPAIGDPAFAEARGALGQFVGDPLKLDNTFALNPLLPQLHALYGRGELAVLQAVGLPYRERSHFDAQQVLESGGTRPHELATGWLGRALPASAGAGGLRAVALETAVPLVLRGPVAVDTWAPSALPDPSPDLVARLETTWRQTGGDLPALYRSLVLAPEAWLAQPAKLKTPEEFVISSARLLGLGEAAFTRLADGGITALGQRVQAAPSPAGWPDRAEEWLGPDAVWKRVEWATRVADRVGRQLDARALAQASLGPLLQDTTARQIERAADGPQALALLLLAPEFQRR